MRPHSAGRHRASSWRNRAANQALIDLVTQVATAHDATPAQVALARLLAQHPSIAPIPGTRRLLRLEVDIGATRLDLPAADLTALDQAATRLGITGTRYNEAMQKMTGLSTPPLPPCVLGNGTAGRRPSPPSARAAVGSAAESSVTGRGPRSVARLKP